MRLGIAPTPLVLLALAACGGSSSETPWPAEPDRSALGPAGEGSASAPANVPEAPASPQSAPEQPDAGR